MRLLSTSAKTVKSERVGVLTGILYLQPAGALCPWSTAACRAVCLAHSAGRMAMSASTRARAWKTRMLMGARPKFMLTLRRELQGLQRRAAQKGLTPGARLDGGSDIGLAAEVAPGFPSIQFYDYTKSAARAAAVRPPNWHVVYSRSGDDDDDVCRRILGGGGSVAVVFERVPETWEGYPVINGDAHDARFLDPPGVVVGLKFKPPRRGRGRAVELERAGKFVVRASGPG